jgi:hypothetical protein
VRHALIFLALVTAWAQQVPADAQRPEALARELRRLKTEIAEGGTISGLPAAWEVQTPDRRYSISTAPLRALVVSEEQNKVKVDAWAAENWLEQLAVELEGASAASPYSPGAARARLDAVLKRSEFAGLREPGTLERWRQQMIALLQSLLAALLRPLVRHAQVGRWLFWIFIVAVTGTLAVWLIRQWTDRGWPQAVPSAARPAVLHDWVAWVRLANQAAARADFREAIRCVYWAGIASLQSAGVLAIDPARTPREYLRLLGAAPSGAGAQARFAKPLGSLTATFERCWYARRTPGAEEFRESLTDLEGLGCKLD